VKSKYRDRTGADARKLLEEAKKARADKDYGEAGRLLLSIMGESALAEEAHLEMGNILSEQNKRPQAAKEYREVLGINPSNRTAFSELAKILWTDNGRKELEKVCRAALGEDPENAQVHLCLGKLYRMTGNYARSIEELEEAFRLDPKNGLLGGWLREEKERRGNRKSIAPYRIYFTWGMLHSCNYSCEYCYVPRNEKHTAPRAEDLARAWKKVYEKYGSCRVRLDGGEPSIFPGFLPLVKEMSKYHRLQINTNLSFEAEPFRRAADPLRVRIDASIHPGQVSLNDFLGKAERLKGAGFKVVVALVAFPETLGKIADIRKMVEAQGFPFLMHPYSGEYKGKIYPRDFSEEEKRLIYSQDRESGTELEWRKDHKDDRFPEEQEKKKAAAPSSGKGKKLCRMGQMYARIYPDGKVFACCTEKGLFPLGNLFDGSFELREEPVECAHEGCRCWRSMVPGEEERWLSTWQDDWEMPF